MDLAFRTSGPLLFFEFIDTIEMIPVPSCLLACFDNVGRYNLNESRRSDDEIRLIGNDGVGEEQREQKYFSPYGLPTLCVDKSVRIV